MQSSLPRLGIVSALPEEQAGLADHMKNRQVFRRGMRDFVTGQLWRREVVCVLSRMGKVAAAATTATLVEGFGAREILFTGVAGGAGERVHIGDIVLAEQLLQHDMDSRPLFPRWEVPLTQLDRFNSDPAMTQTMENACRGFLDDDFHHCLASAERQAFRLSAPRLHRGLVASGDEFIHGAQRMAELNSLLPGLLAVEMEGAAVAQVCHEFGIPFTVVRTISDEANADSPVDFLRFIDKVAAQYAFHIVRRFCGG